MSNSLKYVCMIIAQLFLCAPASAWPGFRGLSITRPRVSSACVCVVCGSQKGKFVSFSIDTIKARRLLWLQRHEGVYFLY